MVNLKRFRSNILCTLPSLEDQGRVMICTSSVSAPHYLEWEVVKFLIAKLTLHQNQVIIYKENFQRPLGRGPTRECKKQVSTQKSFIVEVGGIQTVAVVFYLTRLLLPRSHYCISLQTKRPGRMIYGCMMFRGDPNRWKLWAIIHHVYGSRAQLTYGTRIEAYAALLVYLPAAFGRGSGPRELLPP